MTAKAVADMADDPDGPQLIPRGAWASQRYGWAGAVRADTSLNPTARLVAHILAFDFANAKTARCDPSLAEISDVLGGHKDKAKRAVADLVAAGWVVKTPGRKSAYGFVSRAVVVSIDGGKFAPKNGGKNALKPEPERGQICTGVGAKMHPAYNMDKPYKNHMGLSIENGGNS